jgi:hypothetical protein
LFLLFIKIKAYKSDLEKAKANENQAILFTAAELIGAYIRKSKKQKVS